MGRRVADQVRSRRTPGEGRRGWQCLRPSPPGGGSADWFRFPNHPILPRCRSRGRNRSGPGPGRAAQRHRQDATRARGDPEVGQESQEELDHQSWPNGRETGRGGVSSPAAALLNPHGQRAPAMEAAGGHDPGGRKGTQPMFLSQLRGGKRTPPASQPGQSHDPRLSFRRPRHVSVMGSNPDRTRIGRWVNRLTGGGGVRGHAACVDARGLRG